MWRTTDREMRFNPLIRCRNSPTESLPEICLWVNDIPRRNLKHLLRGAFLLWIINEREVDMSRGAMPPGRRRKNAWNVCD